MLLLFSPLKHYLLADISKQKNYLFWEKAQLVMCFMYKHEDTRLYRQYPCKKSHVAVHSLGRKAKGGL